MEILRHFLILKFSLRFETILNESKENIERWPLYNRRYIKYMCVNYINLVLLVLVCESKDVMWRYFSQGTLKLWFDAILDVILLIWKKLAWMRPFMYLNKLTCFFIKLLFYFWTWVSDVRNSIECLRVNLQGCQLKRSLPQRLLTPLYSSRGISFFHGANWTMCVIRMKLIKNIY